MFKYLNAYMNIIDGRSIAQNIKQKVGEEISNLGITPGLAVILVGADPASHLYVGLKEKSCAEVGIHFEKYLFFATEPQEKIIKKIEELNADSNIHGILVQLPLPEQLDENKIIQAIDPAKDVDGFHPENLKKFLSGKTTIVSPLILGILELIKSTNQKVENNPKLRQVWDYPAPNAVHGKKIAVLANSETFIKPFQKIFEGNEVTAAIAPPDPSPYIHNADIVIIALGRPNLLKGEMVNKEAIIIDVGTNRLSDGKTVGDVDIETFQEKKCWVTPVPGGVGPMTVAMLLKNTLELAKN
jgi:methylenetetrahydrofolate dehydrogenase (NADP+)/methenyltetrahydrofolate cyclohydrolase